MKVFIFVGLISITFAQSHEGYEGGGDDEGYGDVPDDGYAGGYSGEGSYGAVPNQGYGGANLAQLAGALRAGGLEGYDGGYGGVDAAGLAAYGQAGLGDGGAGEAGYGGDDSGDGTQHAGGMEDAAALYAHAASGAGGEGLEALSGAFGGGDSY